MSSAPTDRLIKIILDDSLAAPRNPDVEHERQIAIFDLLEANSFELAGDHCGPYVVHLELQDGWLVFNILDASEAFLTKIKVHLLPLRGIIRDYFTICESYYDAIKHASPSRIEAIDMGRRGLHDDGSDLLQSRLSQYVAVDRKTARRLFTLVCSLYHRS